MPETDELIANTLEFFGKADILEDINKIIIPESAFIVFLEDAINILNPTESVDLEDKSILALGITFMGDTDYDHFYGGQQPEIFVAALVRRFLALKEIVHHLPADLLAVGKERHVKHVLPCVLRAALHAEVKQNIKKGGRPRFDLPEFIGLARSLPL